MKALSTIRFPRAPVADEESRRSAETNQFLLNKNFKQLQDAIRDLEDRIKKLEAEA